MAAILSQGNLDFRPGITLVRCSHLSGGVIDLTRIRKVQDEQPIHDETKR